jgi:hypothetical protein
LTLTPAEKALKKEEQRREGEKNLAEYRLAKAAEERKTERLRELRLAHEAGLAAEATSAVANDTPKTRKRPAAKRAKKKTPAKKTH